MKKLFTLFCFIAVLAIGSQAQNVTVAGSGGAANGSYATLKDAFDALNLVTTQAGNNITLSITGNTTELASAILNQPTVSSWTSLTISPSGGAARTITGAITGNLIDLNGADNVNINGLNTGGNSLTISNTATGASNTLRFINDASNNVVQNCTIQGSASTASNGVIFFSTGTTTGNDGNNINNCNITAAGANQPVNGIFSQGTSAAIDNSGNTLNANNISDFFNAALLTTGINIGTGNSTWAISNNKLFQTATRTYTTANIHNGINVGSGDGNTITGNTIGYAASNATGVYTMAGAVATRFIAIGLAVGTTTTTSVQGNIITAINLSTTSGAATTNGILCGINITAGNVNIGNVTPNIIGASSGTGALVAIPTTTQGSIVGINSSSTGTILIQNNIIGSFSSSGTTAAIAGGVFGINISGAAASMTIAGNTIGNASANNMMAGTLGLTTGSSIASGINAATTPVSLSVTNNTIQNFASYGTGGGYVKGFNGSTTISTTAAYDVSNNIITNLITYGTLTGYTSGASSAVGIQFSGGLNGTCSQNTISNISNLNAAATTNIVVSGITLASGLNNSAFRNKIWGLSNAGTGVTATGAPVVAGIIVRSGTTVANVYNNMISIGDAQTTNTCFLGIMLNHGSTPDPLDNIYFNTVVVSGTSGGGALISSCLTRGDLTATARNQVVDIRNNIFINTRTGGTGNHYAISNNPNSTSSATGWAANASNYNVLNAAASTIGYWTTAQTFAGWQTASASDVNSISGPAVNLVNIPAGDLHILYPPNSVIEAAGISIAAVTDDFDGQVRNSFSPTDIGADAGNFVTAGLNMGAEALVTPAVAANGCYTSAETVTIRIRNSDINPINFVTNPVTVTTNVTGAATQTLTAVVNTGSLGAGLALDVPMTGTLNMGPTGVYTFNAFTAVGGDTNPGNDAMPPVNITKAALAAGTASASPAQYCVTGGTPTLSATGVTGYGSLQWQQSTTSGSGFTNIPGGTTNPFTVGSAITQTMYYKLVASCNGNNVTSNEVSVILNNPQVTGTTPGASCGPGPVTVTLAATGTGSTLNWYDVPSGGIPIGTGSPFTTPPISVNTTYYVTATTGGGITNVGLPAQLAGTSGAGTTNFGLVFDALVPFTLNSVIVYPIAAVAGTAGTVTIDVVNSAGVVLNTATVNVVGNPVASATAQTVTLNFNIAAGTNLKLRPGARSASITGLLFEPSATAPPGGNYGYPFVIPGVLSINHSTLTAPPTNTPRLDLWYYFYNWEVATGCESARTSVLASIVSSPSATISYAGSPYCSNAGTATVTQTGTGGGTYSSTAGLTINPATGAVTLGTSTAGTYTVTYTIPAAGGCPVFTTTASITVTAAPNATISYAGSPYCTTGGTATVTQTGTAGGTYSSTAGLTLNPATGAVTLGTSAPGTYTVTYTIAAAGGCPIFTTTASITVNNCGGACSPLTVNAPTITQPNCATATGTIVINAVGSGTLEYSINGVTYQASATFSGLAQGAYYISVRYVASPNCAMAYSGNPVVISGASSRVQVVLAGASPFQDSLWTIKYPALSPILTHVGPTLSGFTITGMNGIATHPMTGEHYIILKVSGVSGRVLAKVNLQTGVCTQIGNLGDNFSSITFRYDGQMFGVTGDGATVPETMYLIDHTNATKTLARALGAGADGEVICYNPDDNFIYHWSGNGTVVFERIQSASPYAITNIPVIGSTNGETFGAWYKGGGEFVTSNISSSFNIFTTGGTVTGTFGSNPDDLRGLVSKTCVTYLTPACPAPICGNVSLTANGGTGNYQWYLNGVAIGGANASTYTATISGLYNCIFTDDCAVTDSVSAGINVIVNAAPSATIVYAGSPYCSNAGTANVTRTGAAGGTYSSTAGLTLNAATGAVTLGTSTPGTYTVTYTIAASGSCPAFSTTTTITITALPAATIAYTGSPYCQNAGTATVTRTGTAGGTYSSAAGLTINAATGAVTLGTSTPGTYTVTYTVAAAGGCPSVSTTTSITITALPAATIAYTGSPYCSNAGTATVTRTGTAGGTYSSTAGLTINAATGDVNLGTSTAGTYTVTYTIAAAGGCPVVTATTSITITALPAATISYAGSPYCSNAGTATVTRTGTAGGTYSSTAGLSINAATGTVTLGTSTAGTYTVTYTIAAGGGCPAVSTTASIIITALPAATIAYTGSPYCSNAGTATVTRTGTAGGTYNSTAGLTINATTGDITLGTSTAGTYTVTYTIAAGGGCPVVSTTASITINSLSVAATAANSSILVNCGPTTVTLSITGGSLGTGGSWKWYSVSCGGTAVGTGATLSNIPVNSTTTFYVRAEGTCNTTTCASITVTINTQPTISISASPYTSLMPGMLTTLTASVAPPDPTNTTAWYRNGIVVPGANGLMLVVGVDGLGLYTARTTTTPGCTALSNAVNIKDSASNRLFITPNPNNGIFKVRYYTSNASLGFLRYLVIFSDHGQRVYSKSFSITAPYSSMNVDAKHLSKGLYVVMVTDYYGKVLATGKVVIQ